MKKTGFNFDVITIGSATRDAIFTSKEFKTIKSPACLTEKCLILTLGSKIKIDDVYFTTGGAATNTAVTFARQGFKTASIARVGNDLSGETIKKDLENEGVDARFIQTDKKLATAYSVILESMIGERTILNYRGANENLKAEEIPWNRIRTKWIYLNSLSANLKILKEVVVLKKRFGTRLAWNPGGKDLALGLKKLKPYLHYLDVFILNQEEASLLLDIPYGEVKRIFRKIDEEICCGLAVMTLGPKGSYVSDGKILFQSGVYKEKKLIDRTGAGDAFGSGFTAGLMRGKNQEFDAEDIKYALRLGSANATAKVEHVGAKKGLLTKEGFRQKRFQNLSIITIAFRQNTI